MGGVVRDYSYCKVVVDVEQDGNLDELLRDIALSLNSIARSLKSIDEKMGMKK